MRKLIVMTGIGLLALGSVGTADAQGWNRDGGNWGRGYDSGYRRSNGGALAAGLIGGAILGGLASAATTPAYGYGYSTQGYAYPAQTYAYPAQGYAYPSSGYGYASPYGYGAPVQSQIAYEEAPVYQTRVVYQQPRMRTRVVYRQAPSIQRTRIVYRQAPTIRQRVVYRQPRARIVSQRAYMQRDVISTGSIGERREMRMQRRMMRD
jgi:hypothetical protein